MRPNRNLLAAFPSKKYMSQAQKEAYKNSWRGWYEDQMRKNSFLYFGLPFFAMILFGQYVATEFAAVRYDKHDKQQQEISERTALDISGRRRKVDFKQEYYKLQQLDIDNWEQKRVKRLPGESENRWP